jgi:Domain of unknown function (DUF5666)
VVETETERPASEEVAEIVRSARQVSAALAAAGAAAAILATVAAAATPVQGSISGPVTSVKGKTFVVKTTLSPTGSSKVSVGAKTTIHEQAAGAQADLKKGACVLAMGTKKGATVTAQRISLTDPVKGACGGGFGRFRGRGGTGNPPTGRPPSGSNNQGFSRPANFGFASGKITLVKGSTLTVKGQSGSTKVAVNAETQIGKTLTLKVSGIKAELCAFVRGTSSDKGVTVAAQDVALSKPVKRSCTFNFGRRGP